MNRTRIAIGLVVAGALLAVPLLANAAPPPPPPPGHVKFMTEAKESTDLSRAMLPLYKGKSGKQTVWYVVTDASSKKWATKLGANYAPKLTHANRHDRGHERGRLRYGAEGRDLPVHAGLQPGPVHRCESRRRLCGASVPGVPSDRPCVLPVGRGRSYGHSPDPGPNHATGQNSYSPLIQFNTPDGPLVLNAPQIKNSTGQADKILALHMGSDPTVDYVETAGLYDDHTIHYVSFDASNPLAATIENMTYAPAFGNVPGDPASENTDASTSGRDGIIAFTNGPTGLGNPERRG